MKQHLQCDVSLSAKCSYSMNATRFLHPKAGIPVKKMNIQAEVPYFARNPEEDSLELLFVNACPRGKDSRTLALAEHLLRHLQQKLPELIITRHDLPTMRLQPVNARRLKRKEALCDQRNWDDPLTAIGADFQRANAVIIAAPYWDLSFPSILKTWVENIWVRNLTFFYRDDKPVGLAKGKAAVYVTTAGSYTAKHDWGTLYIEDVMKTLGIPAFRAVKAEALDLLSSDPETILTIARTEAESAADWLRKRLTEE